MEAAFAVSQLGTKVSVYDISDYPLPRQLDREGGLFLKQLLEKKGMLIHGGGNIEQYQAEIKSACVIAAVGVRSSTDLAKKCGIIINRGIFKIRLRFLLEIEKCPLYPKNDRFEKIQAII